MKKRVFVKEVIEEKVDRKSIGKNRVTMEVELYLRKVWEVLII